MTSGARTSPWPAGTARIETSGVQMPEKLLGTRVPAASAASDPAPHDAQS